MAEKLIRLHKDEAFLSVHPTCVEAHKKAGWAVAEDQEPSEHDLGLAEPEEAPKRRGKPAEIEAVAEATPED